MQKITGKIFVTFLLLLNYSTQTAFGAGNSLSGTITDKVTKVSLPGVTVFIPELKRGTITDLNGQYKLEDLPSGKILVQVTFVGYKRIIETVDLNISGIKNFELEIAVSELHEIVVTGLSKSGEVNRTPTPITIVPKIQLIEASSSNIIDALTSKPGINQISTGTGISKPVIRGLGYNRVVVVNDGIRQEGQQWGDEHGIEIDEYSINSVEVLKGPASLMYGSDAMAGVINFIAPPSLPEGTIAGNLFSDYQTNNGLIGYSLSLGGNRKNFIWDLRYSQKLAHAYKNRYDGYVSNSGFKENNFDALFGLNKSWGYTHLKFSEYNMKPGIVEGERDSLTGNFIQPVATSDSTYVEEILSDHDLKAYDIYLPYQKINHKKIVLDQYLVLGEGSLKAILGWQQNERKEFSDIFNENQFGLYFLMNTLNYDLRYVLPEIHHYEFAVGINGMYQLSENRGTEYLIPEYNLFDAGIYVTGHKNINKFDFNAGFRFDMRNQNSKDLFVDSNGNETTASTPNAEQRFVAFDKQFNGVSGAVGLTYQISEFYYAKLNLARGYRAPNIAELGSNGEHEGTERYEIGNTSLKAESSLQWDFTFGINTSHVTGELNLFSNNIDGFIYSSKLNNYSNNDSLIDGLPVYKFTESKANLTGGEIAVDIHPHPLDWLHFENSFSYVRGRNVDLSGSEANLPQIPAPKLSSELKADASKLNSHMCNSYIKIGMDYFFEQNKVYKVNNTETETPAYALFNIGVGSDFVNKNKTLFSFYLNVNNLFDKSYQSHLSRLKYAPENYATNRTGVYNMGRNISVKVVVPIGIKKS